MRKLVAHHEIWRASGRMVNSGRYDSEGAPILRAETIIIEPGSFFESDDAEAERLVSEGAAFFAEEHDPHWRKPAPEQTEEGN
jgi:hypothetical protein